ncbi:MAG: hypothetical protein Q8N18_02290 [Opitutaceae bacterium]|nr:hypothetical protein [Opitutaceae bacterium]
MKGAIATLAHAQAKPISVGLTCWRWQRRRARRIVELAQQLEVNLQLKQRPRGLHRDIECQVSGKNVDRFIGEFMRRC